MDTVLKIIKFVFDIIYGIFKEKEKENEAISAESKQKALDTVGDSLNVETKAKEEIKNVETKHETVDDGNGGISFDKFNSGK
ncbi:MAG: hypothetical protein AABY32_04275 [Nanoarchaeota archaeon]